MTEPLKLHIGIAAPLLLDNVDTDQIIPSREMRSTGRKGLADGLFSGRRYRVPSRRDPDPGFVLNTPEYVDASILISGENFGCGSSREHAVWALHEYGFRVIIAHSFGAIFYENCVRNGIAPIGLTMEQMDRLLSVMVDAAGRPVPVQVDLVSQTISVGDIKLAFELDAYDKKLLTSGLDPVEITRESKELIDQFHSKDRLERPWLYS